MNGTYVALQFHIHASSEHTIDGEFFGAELHIVHTQTDGSRYAVVGMMIEATNSDNHEAFESLLGGWATIADNATATCLAAETTLTTSNLTSTSRSSSGRKHRQLASSFNAYDLIPQGSTFYHYDGGLTTPPCSEVVWWNLADTPVSISVSQYNRLTQYILGYRDPVTCEYATVASSSGSTSRPIQALNGRVVQHICPSSFADATPNPDVAPTVTPTAIPIVTPTVAPTVTPTVAPTVTPTIAPTVTPTVAPTVATGDRITSAASFTILHMSTFLFVAAFTLQAF